jgi:hypothetical protein
MDETTSPERSYYEISLENEDGTFSKILEFEQRSSLQFESSDQDTVTLSLPCRIQTFGPMTINQSLSLKLSREIVQKMAEKLGLMAS